MDTWRCLAALNNAESSFGRDHGPGSGVLSGSNYTGAWGPRQIGTGGAATDGRDEYKAQVPANVQGGAERCRKRNSAQIRQHDQASQVLGWSGTRVVGHDRGDTWTMQSAGRATVPGSERSLDPVHRRVSDVDGGQQIEVTVYVRGRAAPDWVDDGATRSRAERRVLSREEWVDVHGADDADLNAIVEFARNSSLEAVSVDSARRAVVLRGTVDAVTGAFEAGLLGLFEHPSGVQYRGRQGPLTVPAELDGIVTGVFGIDDRPQAQPRIRFAVEPGTSIVRCRSARPTVSRLARPAWARR